MPVRWKTSTRFTPAAPMRTSSSSPCGSGTGRRTARSTSGPPARAISIAFICALGTIAELLLDLDPGLRDRRLPALDVAAEEFLEFLRRFAAHDVHAERLEARRDLRVGQARRDRAGD